MREYKVRTVFNNYNLWDDYKEDAVEILKENGIENPTEDQIWDEIMFQSNSNWEDEKHELRKFFDDKTCILMGENERWNGKRKAGTIFTDFMEMYYKAMKDCDYVHIYDINGHLYFKCSHHDGTNFYEIKILTDRGIEYLENWDYGPSSDKRSEQYVHEHIFKRYSKLPHFAHNIYGCPKVEYKKQIV